jgi:hypothetical protein
LDELHIIDDNLFGDEVGLFEAGLVIIIDEPIQDSKLRLAEPELCP